jgi:nucleoid-associated protein YgaU
MDSSGTANTLPFTCFESPEEGELVTAQEPAIWNLLDLPTIWFNASNAELGQRWVAGTAITDRCFEISEKPEIY